MYDIAIIGSGITGTMIARELSKYELNVVVFEKDNDVANGTTMANSAIIHSGYDPKPNTKKGQMNVQGNRMYQQICKEMDVEFKQIGSITVAVTDEDLETLKGLEKRAAENQVPVEMLSKEEVLGLEPNLSQNVKGGLKAPTAGIVGPFELAIALMENAMDNGVELKLDHEILDIDKDDEGYKLTSSKGIYEAKVVINCAGVYADKIHNMVAKPSFKITAKRGEYFVLDKSVEGLVNHVIFPCPTKKGKGVLLVPTVHGNTLVGPTSEYIEDKEGDKITLDGLDYIREHAGKLMESIPYHKVIRSFAGLRPSSDVGDFIIEEAPDAKGFIDVAGIESPGLASAPAIAAAVEKMVVGITNPEEKEDFIRERHGIKVFHKLPIEEKKAIIEKDSKYGTIICRCETITEGEIVECIHRNAGGRTVKGIKKRIRPGMGRCQGGFCEPLVVDLLARELEIDLLDVVYDSEDSNVLVSETKVQEDK